MSWPFRNPWKPDLPCPSGFLPYGLVRCRVSWADFFETPENLIRLARQVFSLMALLGVGSHVLAPGRPPPQPLVAARSGNAACPWDPQSSALLDKSRPVTPRTLYLRQSPKCSFSVVQTSTITSTLIRAPLSEPGWGRKWQVRSERAFHICPLGTGVLTF